MKRKKKTKRVRLVTSLFDCNVLILFQKLIAGLKSLGHKMHRYRDRGSVICGIEKNQKGIFANADFRKAGEVVGL